MKIRAIIVLFVLCIGIYSIHGDLEVKQILHSYPYYLNIVPSIYGNKIVWENLTEGTYGFETDIYLYDISEDKKRKISNSAHARRPAIYGDKIVWDDERIMGNSDIYLYDLSKEEEIRITDASSYQISPKIYGNKIVWIDFRNGTGFIDNSDIYMYDISTGQEKRITQKSCGCIDVAIYGDKIVWEREIWKEKDEIWKPGYIDHDIYLYDLSTGQEKRITDDPIEQYSPKIYGDKIIWGEIESTFPEPPEYRLCLYDLSINEKKIIYTGRSESATIYKDKIIWCGSKNGKSGIYLYDISSGKEKVVTYDYWGNLAMYENTIVWACINGVYSDMYFCNVDVASLLPPTTLPPTTNPPTTLPLTTTLPPTTTSRATTPPPQIPPLSLSESQFFKYLIAIASIFLVGLTISILIIRQKPRKKEKTTEERPKEIKAHKEERVESLELKRLLKERDRLKALLNRLKSQKEKLISEGMSEERYNKMYNQAIEKLKTIEELILLEEESK